MKTIDFEDHIILYAKGWYGKTQNGSIADLSVLLAEYSGTEIQYISKHDVMEFIIRAFVNTTIHQKWRVVDCLKEIFVPLFPQGDPYHRTPEEVFIGKISSWLPTEGWPTMDELKVGKGMLKTSFKVKEAKPASSGGITHTSGGVTTLRI